MAFKIIEGCVNCWACEPLCPRKCTECEGDFLHPQCATICPIEGVILDGVGLAVNPPGSLTGIPPERMAAAMAEIQAR